HARLLLWCADAGERRLRGRDRLQLRQQVLNLGGSVACPDPPDVDEVVAAIDADQERPELAVSGRIAADDDFMASSAFGFGPGIRASGDVWCIGALRNDPFE